MKSRMALMGLLILFLFGSATATSAPQISNCRRACNEIHQSHMSACHNLRGNEKHACIQRAKEAHKQCLRRCK
jgi:hypothetical protein